MCKKSFSLGFISVALLIAILSIYGAQHPESEGLREVMSYIGGLFQLMVPMLAVAALVKYLTYPKDSTHCDRNS